MRAAFARQQSPTAALVAALAVVLAVPFLFRPASAPRPADALPLVIVSPHNEAIRYEFERGFSRWHEARYGRSVYVDWRSPGGTSEIVRYLNAQYTAAFRVEWTRAGNPWSATAAGAFNNRRLDPNDASAPAEARAARAAFLASDVGVGIDLFFGGGTYDHSIQAAMGQLVDSGYRDTPEGRATLDVQIPQTLAGEPWYDPAGRWFGAALASFGICYNEDVIASLPGAHTPRSWRDLGQPALFRQVALADPTMSGSITKAFEMMVQQEMAEAVRGVTPASPDYGPALERGWLAGLNVIRRAAANARYFTDSASKVPLDVGLGNAAAGASIDLYASTEAEFVARRDGTSRMHHLPPAGGTTISADPIGMLRGAPHPETALRFIVFTLSPEGQKLWALKPGTPGGPEHYALHRPPIRRDFYTPDNLRYASDPDLDPYALAERFTYHPEWTGPLFNGLRLLIRTMCIDTGEELRRAWGAILERGGPDACPEAMAAFEALPGSAHLDALPETLAGLRTKIDEVRLARHWGRFFADKYRRAERLAREREPL